MYVGFLSMLSDADLIYTKIKEKICTLEILHSKNSESTSHNLQSNQSNLTKYI